MLIEFEDETIYSETLQNDLFMKAFLKNLCLRPSCHECAFKAFHSRSDITLADFWGIQNILPEFDDDKGVSLVLVNSDAGRRMLNTVEEKVLMREVNTDEALRYNISAVKSAPPHPKRRLFFQNLGEMDFEELVTRCTRESIIKRAGRKIKSKMIRVLKGFSVNNGH